MSQQISFYKSEKKPYYCDRCTRRLTKEEVKHKLDFKPEEFHPQHHWNEGKTNPLLCIYCHNVARTKPRLRAKMKREVKRY